MTVEGLVRLRKHQMARQDTFGTKVAATRRYPFTGVPSVDLQWTDSEVDTGSIVTTIAPVRGPGEFGASLSDPQVAYNTIPLYMEGVLGGNENPSGGTIETWTHFPSAIDPLETQSVFTYEFGDDVTTDWYQLGDGVITQLTITIPEGLGAVTADAEWNFGSAASNSSTDSQPSPAVPTGSLTLPSNQAIVYGKDMSIYIASTEAGLSSGQIENAFHSGVITITQEYDDKRFANGTQTFEVSDRSRTGYNVEYALTLAKTSDTVGTGSETDAWFSDESVDRYIKLGFESTVMVAGSTPYSWDISGPIRYYTREEGESAGNAVIVLTGNSWYDASDFNGFFRSVVVNSLHAAQLGSAAS